MPAGWEIERFMHKMALMFSIACSGCRGLPIRATETTAWRVTCEEAEALVQQLDYLASRLAKAPAPIRIHRSYAEQASAEWVEVDGCQPSGSRLQFVNQTELSNVEEGQVGYVLGLEENSDGSFVVVVVRTVIRSAAGRGVLSENSSEKIPVRVRPEYWTTRRP